MFPVKGTGNATSYKDILDNSVLSTLWYQFGVGPFLLQHDSALVHKASFVKTPFDQFGVEELKWSEPQRPDSKSTKNPWNYLKC